MQNEFEIKSSTLEHVLEVEAQIPEFGAPKKANDLEKRLANAKMLPLVAYHRGKPIAYKLGYALNEDTFYSWLGAVIPAYRGRGIARALLLRQEAWCEAEGFSAIEVKTMNQFKTMLQMLISHDYHIVSVKENADPRLVKIRCRKLLG
ncbi:GNAT family N-acetyltransferase [Pseudoalteromonas xiamenensis]